MNIFDSWICNKYIAHRGFHDEVSPENSLSAFKKAIDAGYAIELDVRPLADGKIVVFHDDTLGRMTGRDGFVANFTYEDLKDIKLLKSNETIPTFEEVLKLVDGQTPLLIEIKNTGSVGFEKDVWKLLSKYKGEYAVQSFNPYSLEWFKIHAPHVKRGQLACFFEKVDTRNMISSLGFFKRFALKRMLLNPKVSEPHFINYKAANIPNKYVKKYSSLPLLVYLIKSPEQYNKVKKYCDNIVFEGFAPDKEIII